MVVGMTIGFEVINYFLNVVILEISAEIRAFLKILSIEILYNVLLTIILYRLILKLGSLLEGQFRQKNILTRYF